MDGLNPFTSWLTIVAQRCGRSANFPIQASQLTLRVMLIRTPHSSIAPDIVVSVWVSDTVQEAFLCWAKLSSTILRSSKDLGLTFEATIESLLKTASSILRDSITASVLSDYGLIRCSHPMSWMNVEVFTVSSTTRSSYSG